VIESIFIDLFPSDATRDVDSVVFEGIIMRQYWLKSNHLLLLVNHGNATFDAHKIQNGVGNRVAASAPCCLIENDRASNPFKIALEN
jgi:UDP-N-acetylenolpyruvoylglucosamine reductase